MTESNVPHGETGDQRISLYTAGRKGLRLAITVGWARALLGAGAALALGGVIDTVIDNEATAGGLTVLGILLALRALLAVVPPLTANEVSTKVETDLRKRVLDAVLRAGPRWDRRTGEVVAEATEGVSAIGDLAGRFLPQLITGMSIPILLALVIAYIDIPTAVVLVLVLPLVPVLLRLLEKRFRSVSARYRETADELAARFVDGIQGVRTLKALGRAEEYGEAIGADAERLRSETMGLLRVNQLALLAVDTLFTLGTVVAAAGMAAFRLSDGAVSVGESVAIVLLGVMLIEPLTQIGRFFYVGAIGRASADQVKRLLALDHRPGPEQGTPEDLAPGMVRLEEVSFAYPDGTQALKKVSFAVGPGEKVALVGPSGAGKTTIAHLILGLLEPGSGTIQVGGRSVLVPQRPFLFHGSIADNLRLGRPDATDDDLWKVLEEVDLAGLIRDRTDGLDAQVGERGLRLSGGEVQRLAIARALLVDAAVVVLDEPTSNVDLQSEARIRTALDRLTKGRTVVIIAHRRSTLADVSRALLIEDGRVTREADGGEAAHLVAGGSRVGGST